VNTRMNFRCPICKVPVNSESDSFFPFCSDHCRLVDLGNWATERYAIPESLPDDSADLSGLSDELEN
jgi:endogenous inhibitor of DNA gyrase (YacG/DUF329 family)